MRIWGKRDVGGREDDGQVPGPWAGLGLSCEERKGSGRGRVAPDKVGRGEIRAEGCGEDFGFYSE